MANALATTQAKPTGLASYLGGEKVRKNIADVIGEKNVTRFVSSVVSAVQANPTLAKCTNQSILSAALQGEALQLAPSPQLGMFYLVSYKNRKKVDNQWVDVEEASFQLGWRGYIQLAIRTGLYKNISVSEIKQGEVEYNPITEEVNLKPIMDPAVRETTPTIGYYAMFELMNGFRKQIYWPTERIQAHAKKYSRGYKYDLETGKKTSPWSTEFSSMAKKTVLRQLIRNWGIMSVEMQTAYTSDMAVLDENNNPMYADSTINSVETQVQEDIAVNANSVEFDEEAEDVEVVVEPEPVKPEPVAKPKQTRTKKAAPAKEEAPAPRAQEPTPIDIPADDDDDDVDWGI